MSGLMSARSASRGFTLLEVMVAVFIVATGMLGFAKMQSLAIASTKVSSVRSLVALQAGSLADAMHGGRAFWSSASVPAAVSAQGGTVTDATGVLSAAVASGCTAAAMPATPSCTPAQLAARDFQQWALAMNQLLPSSRAELACTPAAGAAEPARCILTVRWIENYVSANGKAAADSDATGGERAYTLFIEP